MKEGLTLSSATIVMVTTMMGFGVVMMPKAIDSVGYITGPLILLTVATFCFVTLFGISYASYIFRKMHAKHQEVTKSEELKKESDTNSVDRKTELIEYFRSKQEKGDGFDLDNKPKKEEQERRAFEQERRAFEQENRTFEQENRTFEDYCSQNEEEFTCIENKAEPEKHTKKNDSSKKPLDLDREVKKQKKDAEDKDTTKLKKQSSTDTAPSKKVTYYNVTNSYSPILALLVDISMVVQGVGSCLTYIIAFVKWIPLLLEKNDIPPLYIIGAVIVPLYFLSTRKNLSALRYASYLSVASVVYLLILCVYYCIFLFSVPDADLDRNPVQKTNSNYYSAISAIIFAMGCHQNIVQVFSEMRNKSVSQITLVSLFCILSGTFIYLTIGLAGYLAVGSGITQSILEVLGSNQAIKNYMAKNTFDKNGILVKIGLAGFICVILCAFPMQMHPARDAAVNLLCNIGRVKRSVEVNPNMGDKLKFIITTVFTLFVGVVAAIPNLKYEFVIGLIGATATNAITYIIPGLVFCFCIGAVNYKTIVSGSITVIGVILMGYLLYKQFESAMKS